MTLGCAARLLPALLGAFALAGCAVGPDYRAPELEVPAAWTEAGRGTSAAKAADLSRWWRQLDDPLMSELIDEALAASPDMKTARARLRESRARRDLASAQRFPEVGASAAASRIDGSGETGSGTAFNRYGVGLDASWEADVFGGRRRALEAAQADLEASQADLYATQVSLAAEVALAYVDLRSAQARLATARSNLASQSETLQLTEWRAQAGLTSSLNVEQARANNEQTRAALPLLETGIAESAHRLAILLGRPPGVLKDRLGVPGPIPAAPDTLAVGIPADTLRQRPDVRAAERNLAAATAVVGVAEAARYPNLSFTGSIGLEALQAGRLFDGSAGLYSLAASIVAPVFDAGRRQQQVEIQDALREQALVGYEKTVLLALEEVENALVGLANAHARREALTAAAEAARNAALLARQRFSTGIIDFQVVLDTERTALVIDDALAAAQAEVAASLVRLYKALGGGWSQAQANGTEIRQ
jgi:NodT family efflux transporter outer membrane factor (OMF) lipoprotein